MQMHRPPHFAFICVVICGSPVENRFQMNAFLSAIIHCVSQEQAGPLTPEQSGSGCLRGA